MRFVGYVICCFLFGTDTSATVTPISVKFCIELCPRQCVSPFGGDIFRFLQMRGRKRLRVNRFLPFRHRFLPFAIFKSHDTVVGPDDVHYQMLKHFPNDALLTLLNILNNIWASGKFPTSWCTSTVIPCSS